MGMSEESMVAFITGDRRALNGLKGANTRSTICSNDELARPGRNVTRSSRSLIKPLSSLVTGVLLFIQFNTLLYSEPDGRFIATNC